MNILAYKSTPKTWSQMVKLEFLVARFKLNWAWSHETEWNVGNVLHQALQAIFKRMLEFAMYTIVVYLNIHFNFGVKFG